MKRVRLWIEEEYEKESGDYCEQNWGCMGIEGTT
jgi:hypothetical protein